MKKILLFALLSTFSINAQTPTNYVTGLGGPTGIAFDGTGNLFVADYNAYKVTKITPSLTQSTFIGTLSASPQQIAFDGSGNLWIAGSGNFGSEITKITTTGVVTPYTATNSPYGIAIDASGNVYYSEANSGNIKKINNAGVTSTFVTGLTSPNGMTFDKTGNLIVADKLDGAVKKITPAGVVTTLVSGLANPSNVVYASNGDLYISTGSLGRIFRFPAGSTDGDQYQYIRFFGENANQMTIYNGALYVTNTTKVLKITDTVFLGVEDVDGSKINNVVIYPNPATDYLYIENNSTNIDIVQLFDVTGRLVKNIKFSEITENKIPLSGLNAGTYILKVDNTSKKIILN